MPIYRVCKQLGYIMNDKFIQLKKLGKEALMRVESLTENYIQIGFTLDDVNELLAIALDDDLYYYNCKEEGLLFAPCHALMALGQLKSVEVFDNILLQFKKEYVEEDDYYRSAMIYYFSKIANDKLNLLLTFYLDSSNILYDRMLILESLEKAYEHDIIPLEPFEKAMLEYLNNENELDDGLNAMSICNLKNYTHHKHIELIRETFYTKPVDTFFAGDLEDIEIELGLRDQRETPRLNMFNMFNVQDKKPYANDTAKIGRNEPCPCGSGKKYKKCCL